MNNFSVSFKYLKENNGEAHSMTGDLNLNLAFINP